MKSRTQSTANIYPVWVPGLKIDPLHLLAETGTTKISLEFPFLVTSPRRCILATKLYAAKLPLGRLAGRSWKHSSKCPPKRQLDIISNDSQYPLPQPMRGEMLSDKIIME